VNNFVLFPSLQQFALPFIPAHPSGCSFAFCVTFPPSGWIEALVCTALKAM
jgi:hypothetical protein